MISKLPSVIEIEKLPLFSSFSHHQSNDIGAIFQQMQEGFGSHPLCHHQYLPLLQICEESSAPSPIGSSRGLPNPNPHTKFVDGGE